MYVMKSTIKCSSLFGWAIIRCSRYQYTRFLRCRIVYQSSRKLRKRLLLNNSDFCTDYWVLWSIIKAGLLYIHYSVHLDLTVVQRCCFSQIKYWYISNKIRTTFFQRCSSILWPFITKDSAVFWTELCICVVAIAIHTPSDGRFDRHCLSSWLNVTTIGSLRSSAIPINPTEAIQASEGPQW